ncbi:MAG: hypothetical protein QF582_06070 [Alphaproteobacteria bacterium]|jgi:hypothetical protein|nr:hypothetical protein [Alphaproteobacteria bacterium]MDP6812756.1 hypothetical protein [Alphaproteobacteria bacterium]|tara:strand:- start:266 stop:475 length:210 start_codon:yes stop_codon:yes gene_type:complete
MTTENSIHCGNPVAGIHTDEVPAPSAKKTVEKLQELNIVMELGLSGRPRFFVANEVFHLVHTEDFGQLE